MFKNLLFKSLAKLLSFSSLLLVSGRLYRVSCHPGGGLILSLAEGEDKN